MRVNNLNCEKISKVIIRDESSYIDGKSNNGGGYSFTTIYNKVDNNKFRVENYTSADFPYSVSDGVFGEEGSIDDCKVISLNEVLKDVILNWNKEDFFIEIIYS